MKNLLLLTMCVGLLSLGVGCQDEQRTTGLDGSVGASSSDHERITVDTVTRDMSPELATRSETRDEGRIRQARTIDTNTRTIWDDLRTILLLDRPSRQSLYPTP